VLASRGYRLIRAGLTFLIKFKNKESSMIKKDTPLLIFRSGFSERDEFETPLKGYRNDVIVELPDKKKFPVCFYDTTRLQQDIQDEKIIAEVGLIILKKVTKEKMEEAVIKLWRANYFDSFKPQ
jgi:hypothetical protein